MDGGLPLGPHCRHRYFSHADDLRGMHNGNARLRTMRLEHGLKPVLRTVQQYMEATFRLTDRIQRPAYHHIRCMISAHCVNSNSNTHGPKAEEFGFQVDYGLHISLSLDNLATAV